MSEAVSNSPAATPSLASKRAPSKRPRAAPRPTRSSRGLAIAGAVVLLLVLAVGAYWYKKTHRPIEPLVDELPTFAEPPSGKRAPSTDAFGLFHVGKDKLADVQGVVEKLGIACKDTSARALMREVRAKKKAEAEARGDAPDVITNASWNRPSKREKNPQVRLSCENTDSAKFTDGSARLPAYGRLLFVFDSPAHPLRHVSFQRSFEPHASALVDATGTIASLTNRFGTPSSSRHDLPARDDAGEVHFPELEPIERIFKFADFEAKLSAIYLANSPTVSVEEEYEVPWPVRADAPSRP